MERILLIACATSFLLLACKARPVDDESLLNSEYGFSSSSQVQTTYKLVADTRVRTQSFPYMGCYLVGGTELRFTFSPSEQDLQNDVALRLSELPKTLKEVGENKMQKSDGSASGERRSLNEILDEVRMGGSVSNEYCTVSDTFLVEREVVFPSQSIAVSTVEVAPQNMPTHENPPDLNLPLLWAEAGGIEGPCKGAVVSKPGDLKDPCYYHDPSPWGSYDVFILKGSTREGANINAPVPSGCDGTVRGTSRLSGYGPTINILCESGSLAGIYFFVAHLNSVLVSKGQKVKMGQVIGLQGNQANMGCSVGRACHHLHVEYHRTENGNNAMSYDETKSFFTDYLRLITSGRGNNYSY